MFSISNTGGSENSNSPSVNTGNSAFGYENAQDVIEQANTVSLIKIFRRYKIHCNEVEHTIRCPFKSHKSGQENTGSFKYYHHTNSFNCFGCKIGGACVHFVAAMENIGVSKAADKILKVFKDDVGEIEDDNCLPIDYNERLNLMVEFSNSIREFHLEHPEALDYAELACQKYDEMNLNHRNMSNETLKRMVEKLEGYLRGY